MDYFVKSFIVFVVLTNIEINSQPLQNRLLIAVSLDGLNFTKLNKIFYNFADVPDAVVASNGKVYAYFQGIIEPLHDIISVGISDDGLNNWNFQPVRIIGTESWLVRPCDPDIVYKNGQFRLYFTGDPINDHIPETYSAVSNDGINFMLENDFRFSGGNLPVLDPSLLWIGDSLHYFAGGKSPTLNWHAVSTDGLNFIQLTDFNASGMMMSNGIKVNNGYRFYGFMNSPPQNIRSIFSLDGKIWNADSGIRLQLDTLNILEAMYVKDPAIVFKDSIFIMYYVTRKREYTDTENDEINFPAEFLLYQNYPNPFNPSTKISWQSPVSGWQTLKVYDVLGNEVAVLVNEKKEAGYHTIDFNVLDLSSGVYFYRLQAGSFVQTKQMLLLR